MNVLFVCTGNICRSPMAEVIAREEAAACGLNGVSFGSAGTYAYDGGPATTEAVTVTAELGLDLAGHQSRHLSTALAHTWDLVLAMTGAHQNAVATLAFQTEVRMLSEYLPRNHFLHAGDIPDPYGMGLAAYREGAEVIALAVRNLVRELRANERRNDR